MLEIIGISILILIVSAVLIHYMSWLGFVTLILILSLIIAIVGMIFWYNVDGYQTEDILTLSRGAAITFAISLAAGWFSSVEI